MIPTPLPYAPSMRRMASAPAAPLFGARLVVLAVCLLALFSALAFFGVRHGPDAPATGDRYVRPGTPAAHTIQQARERP